MRVVSMTARAVASACALWVVAALGVSPAPADDNAAWFGETFKGTNLGLSAGMMKLGAGRHEGTTRRRARGTQVASLGTDYAVDAKRSARSAPNAKTDARRKNARRTRTASLGDTTLPGTPPARAASAGRPSAACRAPHARRQPGRRRLQGRTPSTGPAVSGGGGIRWAASSGCLNSGLRSVVASVASLFGGVTVNSTCRSRGHNRRVGGARQLAPSDRQRGGLPRARQLARRLGLPRSAGGVGGMKHYGGGLFHIDTGARRSW